MELSAQQVEALRFMVRQKGVCSKGLYCDNPKCIYGHRCTLDYCAGGGSNCRFPLEMHGVDTNVVPVVEVVNSAKRRRSEALLDEGG